MRVKERLNLQVILPPTGGLETVKENKNKKHTQTVGQPRLIPLTTIMPLLYSKSVLRE